MKIRKLIFIFLLIFNYSFPAFKRIISLAPNITEMVYFIGAGKNLIANTIYCDFPEDAKRLPKIGDLWNFDIEKIFEYNPDFVLASFSGNSKSQVERLENLGIKVYTLKEEKVVDILSNIAFLGELFGIPTTDKISTLNKKILGLEKKKERKKVLLLLSIKPYYSISTNTFIYDVLKIAGYDSVVVSKVRYPILTEEDIARLDFDLVFVSSRFKTEERYFSQKLFDLGKHTKIYFIDENKFSRPGPRIFDFIVEISELKLKN